MRLVALEAGLGRRGKPKLYRKAGTSYYVVVLSGLVVDTSTDWQGDVSFRIDADGFDLAGEIERLTQTIERLEKTNVKGEGENT